MRSNRSRVLRTLVAALLAALVAAPSALADEWESMRERLESKLKTYADRLAEIEGRERGTADRDRRTEKMTRDRIAASRALLKSGGRGKDLAEASEKLPGGGRALADLHRQQTEYADGFAGEWGVGGAERKKLQEAVGELLANIERSSTSLARAAEAAEAAAARANRSGLLDQVARIETEASDAGERLRARWQRERAAQAREREQREREAAERARGVR